MVSYKVRFVSMGEEREGERREKERGEFGLLISFELRFRKRSRVRSDDWRNCEHSRFRASSPDGILVLQTLLELYGFCDFGN